MVREEPELALMDLGVGEKGEHELVLMDMRQGGGEHLVALMSMGAGQDCVAPPWIQPATA